jgi:hypothetical protein
MTKLNYNTIASGPTSRPKMSQKGQSQKGQGIIIIFIIILLIAGGITYFIFARKGKEVPPASTIPMLSVKSDKSEKIKLSGNQTEPHTIWLGNQKGLRFLDEKKGELMRITSEGRVGIGTASPSATLTVLGDLLVRDGGVLSSKICLSGECKTFWPTGEEKYWGSQEENLYSLNPGNVGIGTQNPSEKLEVVGRIKAEGLCLGQDCKAAWPTGAGGGSVAWSSITNFPAPCPSDQFVRGIRAGGLTCATPAGGGDITAVLAGPGLSGGGTSGDVTLSANINFLQKRVAGTCPDGAAIRVITADGTVTCQNVGTGTGGGTLGGSGTPPAITRWIGTPGTVSATLGNSIIYQVGQNIGIGTQNPGQALEVNGVAQAATFYASTGISTFDATVPAGTIEASKFCLGNGTNCITGWPGGGGGGTVSQINQGAGITLSPNPITTTGTISLATQNCSPGQFVTGIGGIISCATPAGGGDITGVIAGAGLIGGGLSGDVTLDIGAGTGISVDADAIRLSYPTKSCPSGQAIQAFDLGLSTSPTCVTTGGGVTGSGTPYFIPSWASSTTLTNSIIYQSTSGGGRIGILNTTPGYTLDVYGDIRATNALRAASVCIGNDCRSSWPSGGGTLQCVEKGENLDGGTGATIFCDSGYTPTGWAADDYRVSANRVDTTYKYCAFYNWGTTRVSAYCICCRVQ